VRPTTTKTLRRQVKDLADAWLLAGAGYENDPAGRVVLRHGQVLRDLLAATQQESPVPPLPPAPGTEDR
jgi:hypothetical protein